MINTERIKKILYEDFGEAIAKHWVFRAEDIDNALEDLKEIDRHFAEEENPPRMGEI